MTAEALIEHAMDAHARNREQRMLIVNPSEEIDSLVEHVNALARSATPTQREHVHALIRLVRLLCQSNDSEGEYERLIAGAIEQLDRADGGWSLRRAVRELREPLAVLTQPTYSRKAKQAARAHVQQVIRDCPRDLLVVGDSIKPTLAHELRAAKSTALWNLILETGAGVKAVTYKGGRGIDIRGAA